jgi:heme/copper-type cytochrome/quinol oxidase subunit 1
MAESKQPSEFEQLLGTGDHAMIGRLFIGFSMVFLLAGLLARILVGIDTGTTNGFLGSYVQMINASSTVALIFLGVIPFLLGLAFLIVPLQVGSPAVAFPRAAALSFWGWLIFGGVFLTSMALDGGIGGADTDAARLGNISFGALIVALALGSICVATTVLAHRPAGMSLARVPLFAWSMVVAAAVWVTSIGAGFAYVVLGHVINGGAAEYLGNFATGLAWLTRAPAVFMVAIPVLGIAADVVVTATGRRLFNYQAAQGLIALYGILSFGAWAISDSAVDTFLYLLWTIGTGAAVVGLLGLFGESLRQGKPRVNAAFIGSLLSLVNLLGAVLVGLIISLNAAGSGTLFDFGTLALAPAQMVFVVAAAVTGGLAGMAHWSVKVWGSEADDKGATAAIALADIGGGLLATVLAVAVFVQGDDGTAETLFGWLAAGTALVFFLGVAGALVFSLGAGFGAEDEDTEAPVDPFDGLTLEWQTPSPAVGGERTEEIPEIASPYPLLDAKEGA